MKNIACNLIYNNGDEGANVGFNGHCDVANIVRNVKPGNGKWCSQPACSCRRFQDRGFTGALDPFPCNESRLFHDWTWNPGAIYATGEPFKVKNTGVGKYAILTTRFPDDMERDRKIIGFLKIKSIKDQQELIASKPESLRLSLDDAKQLNFWSYHRNTKDNEPQWKQGRFRYLEDDQVAAVLHDLKDTVKNASDKALIIELLEKDFVPFVDKRPKVNGAIDDDNKKKIELQRKYGKGGESPAHKKLKEHVAANPELIGLKKADVDAHIEHGYLSGDRVDILFGSKSSGIDTVVEIELNDILPGIHQAIKYRALRCSQRGLALDSPKVKAVIVAWQFSAAEERLCDQYNIRYFSKRL
ncbi:MAG: hypothetical protein H6592_01695 [Flavobacteriales bacterium]|nr:hypothetical protein [Flavobacteriales bacterium]